MTRRATAICAAVAAAAALAGAAPASQAQNYSFSLNVGGPTAGVVGQPMVFQITGQNPPPASYWYPLWLSVVAFPAGIVPDCPASEMDAGLLAPNTGGRTVIFTSQEVPDAAGNFSNVGGFAPSMAGPWVVCAYTDDGLTTTLARASLRIDIRAGGPPAAAPAPSAPPPAAGGAKPANTKAPGVSRTSGKLVCKPGTWSNKSGRYSYRWLMARTGKKVASGRTLRITRRLRGRKVQCSVTASNPAGITTAVSRPVRVG